MQYSQARQAGRREIAVSRRTPLTKIASVCKIPPSRVRDQDLQAFQIYKTSGYRRAVRIPDSLGRLSGSPQAPSHRR